MFKPHRALLVLAGAAFVVACQKPGAAAGKQAGAVPLDTDPQKFGYAVGVDLGHSLAQVKDDVDIAALEAGIEEGAAGKTPRLDDKARAEIKAEMAKKIQQKQIAERQAKADENAKKGEAFLADNAKKPGVHTTPSGLQYEIEKEGSGDAPTAADKVTVNYKGTLLDGSTFDSSYDRGEPATFPLANVIPGWTEGLQLMKPGAKYKFYIPAKLAYGERGAGGKIGPNETLVFEVELLGVEKPKAPKAEDKKDAGKK